MEFKLILNKTLLGLFAIESVLCAMQQSNQAQIVTVFTEDNHEIKIPKAIALKSSVIENSLEMAESTTAIVPLPEVRKTELDLIISILQRLDAAEQTDAAKQTKIKRSDGAYIAQRIQPIIDAAFAPVDKPEIGKIIRAAEYLDLEYIVNGAIRVLTQKALNENRSTLPENIMAYLYSQRGRIKKAHHQPEGLITALKPLFEKHHALLIANQGTISELSIADYIEMHGMPIIQNNDLILSNCKLTSLDGLHTITGQITGLVLSFNHLVSFPAGAFNSVPRLRVLNLSNNMIQSLPANLFQSVRRLKELYLSFNKLTALPDGIFNNLARLEKLALDGNAFKAKLNPPVYPFPRDIFIPLIRLRELYVINNPFSNEISKADFILIYRIANDIYIM